MSQVPLLTWGIVGLSVMLTAGLGTSALAADIDDLKSTYNGAWHSTTNADFENVQGQFTVSDTSTGGKFTGFLAGVPISGKVTSTGKVTFSGKSMGAKQIGPLGVSTGTAKITKGKAQLSATGRFLVGSFTYQGTGDFASRSGKYLLGMGEASQNVRGSGGVGASAGPDDLAGSYFGGAYKSTDANPEAFILQITNLQGNGGQFTGLLGAVPITGTVNGQGKVRFKGSAEFESGNFSTKGKGQLSATGRFMVGSFKSKATGGLADESGKFTFVISALQSTVTQAAGDTLGSPN